MCPWHLLDECLFAAKHRPRRAVPVDTLMTGGTRPLTASHRCGLTGPSADIVSLSHRYDFYQTQTAVIASFFHKKIDKDAAKVEFKETELVLDLPTTDAPVPKRYKAQVPLYASIDPAKSTFKILGTKLEVSLAKADGSSWPVLRSDDRLTGEILQIGRAGRA
jgi:hypothetical protein